LYKKRDRPSDTRTSKGESEKNLDLLRGGENQPLRRGEKESKFVGRLQKEVCPLPGGKFDHLLLERENRFSARKATEKKRESLQTHLMIEEKGSASQNGEEEAPHRDGGKITFLML